MVFAHPVDRKVFHRDKAVAVHKSLALLVREVSALVLDALVNLCHYLTTLPTLPAALRGLDTLAVGGGDDVFEANVHTNGLHGLRQRLSSFADFTREAHKPLARSTLANSGRLDGSFERAVNDRPYVAYLREEHPARLNPETALRVGERVVAVRSAKAQIARFFSRLHAPEERLESKVYANGYVLEYLRMNLSESRVYLLQFGEACLLRIQRRTLARLGVCIPALGEKRIV